MAGFSTKKRAYIENRERGVLTYDIKTGKFGTVAPDYVGPPKRKQGKYLKVSGKKRSGLCLEFGNSFFLDSFLKESGFYPVIDAVVVS